MNPDKTIHEAMGLCWHEKEVEMIVGQHPKHDCCGRSKCFRHVIDYTEPVPYCALMDWMREDDRYKKLNYYWRHKAPIKTAPWFVGEWLKLIRQEQITLIAEAIEAGVLK